MFMAFCYAGICMSADQENLSVTFLVQNTFWRKMLRVPLPAPAVQILFYFSVDCFTDALKVS